MIAELADDVTKLTDLYTRIDNRQRSGLNRKRAEPQSDSARDCAGCGGADAAGVPELRVPLGDGADRSVVRERLHQLAKERGLR